MVQYLCAHHPSLNAAASLPSQSFKEGTTSSDHLGDNGVSVLGNEVSILEVDFTESEISSLKSLSSSNV
ncbi:hypothetical protein GQ457_12G029220 [Hibiscus cannabinus]